LKGGEVLEVGEGFGVGECLGVGYGPIFDHVAYGQFNQLA